ncbi:hypothetical protein Tco_0856411 [Tanacetum coccineum]|uniref:Uncharacterized protein n=1 Tax=Tanacetum coccineum TaxID=301880 RepID=A0ABQ5B8Y3_9ASTR
MAESAKRHEENSNIIKEIRASTDAAIRNQGASIKTLEIQIGQMSKGPCKKEGSEACPALQKKTLETKSNRSQLLELIFLRYTISGMSHTPYQKEKDPGSFTLPYFIRDICFDKALVDLGASELLKIAENVILDIPEDKDVPLILERPFLSTAHSKIDVFENKITLRVGDKKLVFKESDESFDPTYDEYLELNDLETPLETKRDRDDGFILIFVKTGSYKIEFSCVIGCKNKDEGKSQAETLIDIPVFVGKFSIISGFTIIDDDEIISQH